MAKTKANRRMNILLVISFLLAVVILTLGGLKEQESFSIIQIVLTMAITVGGFGLVAFQVAHASDELKKDFIETSIIMIISAICAFFYLVYPGINFGLNFGETSIFLFFWALILLLIILVDRRFDILK